MFVWLRVAARVRVCVKVAGGKAVARLFAGDRRGKAASAFANVMMALLGPDQGSEVQRQALLTCYKALGAALEGDGNSPAKAGRDIDPVVPQLLPCICSILQREPNSQVKAAAEQLLKRSLGLAGAGDAALEEARATAAAAGGTAKAFLTDAYLRRLLKMAEDDWGGQEAY